MKSVAGIVFSPDRAAVLLIQRRDVPVWVLPGGGIEEGESPVDAIEREILEETGFHVKVIRLVGTYFPVNRLAKKTLLFECRVVAGEAQPTSESRSVAFHSLFRLPKLLPPPYPEWIADGLSQKAPVEKKLTGVTYPILLKNLVLHPVLVIRFLLARMGMAINS